MEWFLFALLSALFVSGGDFFSKHGIKRLNENVMAFCASFFTFIFALIFLSFSSIPLLGESFWLAWVLSTSLNVMALTLFFRAIKNSDISLVVPLLMLTPLFIIVVGPIITGEFPTIFGIAGAMLIAAGAYVLRASAIRHGGILEPFRSLARDKGAQSMGAVALIYSVTASIDKVGVLNSSAIFWPVSVCGFMAVILFFRSRAIIRKERNIIAAHLPILAGIGLMGALAYVAQNIAISQANVLYVNSIKRLSVVLTVLQGHLLFNENGLMERLLGALIMFAGVLVIRFLGA